MTVSQRSRAAVRSRLTPGTAGCLLLLLLSAFVLAVAPATASAAAASGGSNPLALLVLQQAEMKDPDAAVGDQFGWSVALSGDTALVGACFKTVSGHAGAGAAYIYTRSGTTWSQQAELNDPDAASGDDFGFAVSLSGDTALVGTPGTTLDGQGAAGAAYVYTRSGTTWSQQTELNDPDAASGDDFGSAVSLSGDTVLVGAVFKTVSGHTGAGAAYIYTRSGTTWSQQAKLNDPDAVAGDQFGYSVALAGNTALVGDDDKTVSGQPDAGAAYVYVRSGTSWSQQTALTAPDAATNDAFGSSVALAGDTALVGADGKTVSGQSYAGAAYVYTRTGTAWPQQAELSDPDAGTGDQFGISVALAGNTVLIGASYKTVSGQSGAGAAYVYTGWGTSWSQSSELAPSDATANDLFGCSLALSGDTALVGAYSKTVSGQEDAGAAYMDLLTPAPSPSLKAKPISIKVGKSVTLSGLVKHFLATNKTVQIERKVSGKLTLLKTLTLTKSGAFTWATKPNKTGKWVFEAAYAFGGVSYVSKPVTVKVHK